MAERKIWVWTELLGERTPHVLGCIYSVFTEGYWSTAGPSAIRDELCDEGVRLAGELCALMPDERETHALAALTLLRHRAFAVYTVSALMLCVTLPFSGQVAPLLLKHLGVPRPVLCLTLTIAQSIEIVALGLLPMIRWRSRSAGP